MAKRNKKVAAPPTQEQIKERAAQIVAESAGTDKPIGFVKAAIYARREFGLVPKNLGKVRIGKRAAARAERAAAREAALAAATA